MPKLLGLRCRECGAEYELQATHVCEMCFGPLDAVYDEALLRKIVKRDRIESGPKSMWRYRDLLPVEDSVAVVTLGEGLTPLVKADRLGAELGLRNLYLKNDSMNPTNSFKDRVVSVAISWARAHGFETIACASTGNLANAVAAYAARAGLECFVFIPIDLEPAKVAAISVFDPNLVVVRGARVPAFTGAQALGCAPVYNAFHSDTPDRVLPVKSNTIAKSIAIGNPSDGVYVNRIARETGGVVEAVTEEEIVEAIRLLARTEGIFTETAGGVTIGVLAKLARA